MPMTTINGYRHFYEDVGSGEPVVLLHGMLNSSRYFAKLIPDLATDFRVVAPHLRGMGYSEHVAELSAPAWADDVVALLDTLGIERAHFYGVSLGAIIAMRLAIDLPERVLTLTVDSPVFPSDRPTDKTRSRPEPPATVVEELRAMHGDDWRTVQDNCDRYPEAPEMWTYLNVGEEAGAIVAPTLIIRGDIEEPYHPLMHAIQLHDALPSSWLWIAPCSRSLLSRRQPADSLRVFRQFVSESVRAPFDPEDHVHRQQVELLAALDLFAGLSEGPLARLAALAQVVTLRAGEVVFRQDDHADGLYVVARGAFSVSTGTAHGEVPVRSLAPGDYFGEMALLTNEPRSATVRCEHDGELLCINRTHICALLDRDVTVTTALAAALSQYVKEHNQALAVRIHEARGESVAGQASNRPVSRHGALSAFGP